MKLSLYWFRRDLRLHDNVALYYAIQKNAFTLPIFIFDTNILNDLPEDDKRVNLIYDSILNIKKILEDHYSSLLILYGNPIELHKQLLEFFEIQSLYFNEDYEPYPIKRDQEVIKLYKKKHIPVYTYCDHIIFKPNEILKEDQTPYHVYSQFKKQWFKRYNEFLEEKQFDEKKYNIDKNWHHFLQQNIIRENLQLWKDFFNQIPDIYENINTLQMGLLPTPALEKMNFKRTNYILKPLNLNPQIIKNYHMTRDIPSNPWGTSNASVYLRFGLESVRYIATFAKQYNQKLLEELIWREFYIMILYFYPNSIMEEWNPKYSFLKKFWRNPIENSKAKDDFERWKEGKTGYFIVDAGMRELKETGYMHNRVRMNCASFLVKDLHIDWRFGERYFALKLMDFELASNVGNWQWVAGTGVDAAPYFRIFNPIIQQKKFDPDLEYARQWIQEIDSLEYPQPIIDHDKSKNVILEFIKNHV